MNGQWEHFSHGADIGVRGIGDSVEQAFENAALALTAVVADLDQLTTETVPEQEVALSMQAPDRELLLTDWLNAIVYEMATRRLLFHRFEVVLADDGLTAKAWGRPVDRLRHEPTVEVKGATYTELRVARQEDGRWLAQCVVDV